MGIVSLPYHRHYSINVAQRHSNREVTTGLSRKGERAKAKHRLVSPPPPPPFKLVLNRAQFQHGTRKMDYILESFEHDWEEFLHTTGFDQFLDVIRE